MPLLWFSLTFVLGIAAAPHISISPPIIWAILILSSTASIFEVRYFRNRRHVLLSNTLFKLPFAILIFAAFLGILRFQNAYPDKVLSDLFLSSENPDAVVYGTIRTDPVDDVRYTSVILTSEEIVLGDGKSFPIQKQVRLSLPPGYSAAYGNVIRVSGTLKRTVTPGDHPNLSRDSQNKIFLKMTSPQIDTLATDRGNPILASIYRFRAFANEYIFQIIPPPESGVLSGMLLGMGESIPDLLWNGYRASGIAHILVISGYNISIIAVLLFQILKKRLRMDRAILITIVLTVIYAIFVGSDTPVVRAAIMATISLPGAYVGRKSLGIHNLAIAAAGMLFLNPFLFWNISFQLSFLATLSLLVMANPITNRVTNLIHKNPGEEKTNREFSIIEIIISTLCASFAVFPVLFKLTGSLSLSSLPANILVAPVQPFIMLFGGASVLIGLIFPALGSLIGKLSWPFIAFCNQVALRLSIHPAATVYLPKWLYVISIMIVSGVLVLFSINQIFGLTRPRKSKSISDR